MRTILTVTFVAFLLILATKTYGQSTVDAGGDKVNVTATARKGGVEKATAYFRDEQIKASAVAIVGTHSPSPSPSFVPSSPTPVEPEEPEFPVDFNTTESSLRTFIFQANIEGAAHVLTSPRFVSLAAGLTYPEELRPLVQPSAQRNEDPDVVAFKAIALSALRTGEARKLATAAVLSFRPDCECSIYTSEEQDELIEAFTIDFMNAARMKQILSADANKDESDYKGKRKLTSAGSSPINSLVCSSCWPKKECKKCHWCKCEREC